METNAGPPVTDTRPSRRWWRWAAALSLVGLWAGPQVPVGVGSARADSSTASVPCSSPPAAYETGLPPAVGFPDDPLADRQWGLAQIKAPSAWARNARGAGVTIAILDSGVDYSHPDLDDKLLAGADFGPEGGCPGAQDEHGHGTAVAGIAAAETDNGIGIAGVAPKARILPVKTGDAVAADYARLAEAVRWAVDRGARVINLSDGVPVTELGRADEVTAAVRYAYEKDVVVVAAAGNTAMSPELNTNGPFCVSPAFDPYAVCVAGSDARGLPVAYSNLPVKPSGVAVRAPTGSGLGVSGVAAEQACTTREVVWTTRWPGTQGPPSRCVVPGYYGALVGGTSLAAPHVAGVAALLAGRGLTAPQVFDCLRRTSSNRGAYDPVMGYGIVDADAATRHCHPGGGATRSSYARTALH